MPAPLSSKLKCPDCRRRKIKCIRKMDQKCEACIRGRLRCGPSRPSDRALRLLAERLELQIDRTVYPSPDSQTDSTGLSANEEEYLEQYPYIQPPNLYGSKTSPEAQDIDVLPTSRLEIYLSYRVPSPMLQVPIEHCPSTSMSRRLDERMGRLWGNYDTFVRTKKVSKLFAKTISEFFAITCRQMARDYPMVQQALYACATADALMSKRLTAEDRRVFKWHYDRHDLSAIKMVGKAIASYQYKVEKGEHADILPLYFASFLLHASGACTRGASEIELAIQAFKYFDKRTAAFPLRIRKFNMSDDGNDWTVQMLLANNPYDPGMEVRRSSCILGKQRLEYDRGQELSGSTRSMELPIRGRL